MSNAGAFADISPVEIFNTGIRAKGIMITSMASWIASRFEART